VTKNWHDLKLSALSKAVQVTGVMPDKNKDPLAGTHDVLRIPELSEAVELIL
jgi:hypothetical protein